MRTGKLANMLKKEPLNMRDTIQDRIGNRKFPTWFRGQEQIDAIWTSEEIEVDSMTYLPFFFSIGDHRGIVMDIPEETLLGNKMIQIEQPQARRLISKRCEVKKRYVKLLNKYFVQHDLGNKIKRIKNVAHTLPKAQLLSYLNHLDKIKTAGMQHAERKCRKLHMGDVPYFPGLAEKARKLIFWRLIYRKKQGAKIKIKYLRRCAKTINFLGSIATNSYTLESIKCKLEQAYKAYHVIKQQAWECRRSFLFELQEKAEGKEKSRIKDIRKREEIKYQWRIWKIVSSESKSAAVLAVETVREGQNVRILERLDLERAIMQCLSKRFSLTSDSLSMSPQFTSSVGYLAEKDGARQILLGEIPAGLNYNSDITEFLSLLSIPSLRRHISSEIRSKDFVNFWHKAKERTSSSFLGLHFGHYKCILDTKELVEFNSEFLNIVVNTGIVLERWTKGLSVMLEKIKGNINVEKLRGILLMEADYNFISKLLIGVRLMSSVEHRKGFPEELGGSRKHHDAVDIALNRRITSDIMRQNRRPGTISGVDAASCYDRIVHSIVILIARQEGLSLLPLLALFGTIQKMTYFVRTGHGESNGHYGGLQNIPFQGTCQGNGASPAYWLLISMMMVLVMHKKGHAMSLKYPITPDFLKCIGFLFVDDTDLIVIGDEHDTRKDVCYRQQQSLTCWENVLQFTGGALKAPKCYWYLIDFEWKHGIWQYANTEGSICTIKGDDRRGCNIHSLPLSEANKTMGVWQNMTGDNTHHIQQLIETHAPTITRIINSDVSRRIVWKGFFGAIWSSIRYGLPSYALTEKEGAQLFSKIFRPLFNVMGLHRTFPTTVATLPVKYMGLGIPDPYIECGIARVKTFITHMGSETLTSGFITYSLQLLQIEMGFTKNVLEYDYDMWGYLATPSWITSLWEFVSRYNIVLKPPEQLLPNEIREGDTNIMQTLYTLGYRKRELIRINRVRIFLQVLYVSDIVEGNGKKIKWEIYQGTKPTNSVSDIKWRKERPSKQDFRTWKMAIKRFAQNRYLLSPLRRWVNISHNKEFWQYDISRDRLIFHSDGEYVIFCRIESQYLRGSNSFMFLRRTSDYVHSLVPTSVSWNGSSPNIIQMHGYNTFAPSFTSEPDLALPVLNDIYVRHSSADNKLELIRAACEGELGAVTDASYTPTLNSATAAAAWIMETKNRSFSWEGSSLIFSKYNSSYGGEIYGIYLILRFLDIMWPHKTNWRGIIQIKCDNLTGVNDCSYSELKLPQAKKIRALLRAIRKNMRILEKRGLKFDLGHIKGHQDENCLFHHLDRWAQLNVIADQRAKNRLQSHIANGRETLSSTFHEEGWSCWLGATKCEDFSHNEIRNWIFQKKARWYWSFKQRITYEQFDLIDWNIIAKVMEDKPQLYRLWFSKHHSNWCGCGKNMVRWKFWDSDLCPCCLKIRETSPTHVFFCEMPEMVTFRNELMSEIVSWMKDTDTQPHLFSMIVSALLGDTYQLPTYGYTWWRPLKKAFNTIPQILILQGFLPKGLDTVQQDYYRLKGSRATGATWLRKLCDKLINATHSLWTKRNSFEHEKNKHGLRELEDVRLEEAVKHQYALGTESLNPLDRYLLRQSRLELWAKNGEYIRAWLTTILIARGEHEEARKEMKNDRGNHNYYRKRATEQEITLQMERRKETNRLRNVE